jgi:hypothetical protein
VDGRPDLYLNLLRCELPPLRRHGLRPGPRRSGRARWRSRRAP